jgi:hypothetical protein
MTTGKSRPGSEKGFNFLAELRRLQSRKERLVLDADPRKHLLAG